MGTFSTTTLAGKYNYYLKVRLELVQIRIQKEILRDLVLDLFAS
jgi:hypothetical protein